MVGNIHKHTIHSACEKVIISHPSIVLVPLPQPAAKPAAPQTMLYVLLSVQIFQNNLFGQMPIKVLETFFKKLLYAHPPFFLNDQIFVREMLQQAVRTDAMTYGCLCHFTCFVRILLPQFLTLKTLLTVGTDDYDPFIFISITAFHYLAPQNCC